MYEIFARLLEEKRVTPYKVHKATGVAQSSLSDWKNGVSKPKYEKMKLIADYFGVSVDYLLGNEQKEKPATTNSDGLNARAVALLESVQDFSAEEWNELIQYASFLIAKRNSQNKS